MAQIAASAPLELEFEESLKGFFARGLPQGNARDTLLAARRHLEWFLLERHSASLRGVPIDRLQLPALEETMGAEWTDGASGRDALAGSFTGVFVVEESLPGEGAWGRATWPASPATPWRNPKLPKLFELGDLVVGRLFPLGSGLHHLSRAAGFFRDEALRQAFEQDLERIRTERAGKVLHLGQAELETMFFGPAPGPASPASDDSGAPLPGDDPLGEARSLLERAGLDARSHRPHLRTLVARALSTRAFGTRRRRRTGHDPR